MQSASFQGANIYGGDLHGGNGQKVNMSCANLQGGDLVNGSNWQQTDLTGALATNAPAPVGAPLAMSTLGEAGDLAKVHCMPRRMPGALS